MLGQKMQPEMFRMLEVQVILFINNVRQLTPIGVAGEVVVRIVEMVVKVVLVPRLIAT